MKKYICSVCGYIYDEAKGIPEAGIVSGTKWEDLPADWVCPLCGATKAEFKEHAAPERQCAYVLKRTARESVRRLSERSRRKAADNDKAK